MQLGEDSCEVCSSQPNKVRHIFPTLTRNFFAVAVLSSAQRKSLRALGGEELVAAKARPVTPHRVRAATQLGLNHWLDLVQVLEAEEGSVDDLVFGEEHEGEALADEVQSGESVQFGDELDESLRRLHYPLLHD